MLRYIPFFGLIYSLLKYEKKYLSKPLFIAYHVFGIFILDVVSTIIVININNLFLFN